MNYYERYCGDYQRDTAHLSLCEHGAYTMLLDTYYSTEKPLPADHVALYRICRAMDKAEQAAVRAIADQFFPVGDDGLRHNRRADEMIGEARPRIEAARENGKKGGRPRKFGNPTETQEKPSGFSLGNPPETHDESSPAPAPTPLTSKELSGVIGGIGTNGQMAPAQISAALIDWERKRNKAARGISASNQQVIDLAAMRVTAFELRRAYDGAVADRDATEDPNPINAGFVRTFIDKYRRPQAVRPQHRSYHDDRRETIEGLTGRNRKHDHDDVIELAEQPVARLAR